MRNLAALAVPLTAVGCQTPAAWDREMRLGGIEVSGGEPLSPWARGVLIREFGGTDVNWGQIWAVRQLRFGRGKKVRLLRVQERTVEDINDPFSPFDDEPCIDVRRDKSDCRD